MKFFAYAGLINGIIATIFGFFVYSKNRKQNVNKNYGLLSLSIAIWSYAYFFWQISLYKSAALFWCRVLSAGSILIPIFYFHFILALLNLELQKKKYLFLGYIISIIFLILDCTPFFVIDVSPRLFFKFWPAGGIIYLIHLFYFFGYVLFAWFLMLETYYKSTSYKRNQIKYVLFASIIGFLGGATNFPLWYNIPILPLGNILVSVHTLILAYAIVKYRLMDIQVIIRETAIFAGIYSFAVGVFVLIMLFGQTFLAPHLGSYDWALPISAIFLITFGIRPIERTMYNTVGRRLFKRKFEYQKALRDASIGMARIKQPDKLLNLIVHILTKKLRVNNAGILLLDESTNYYTLKVSRGEKSKQEGLHLAAKEPLINWLFEKKDTLVYEEVDRWLKDETSYSHKSVLRSNLDKIKEQMEMLGASVCIPSFYRDVLLGILILGDKVSGDMYSQDDLDLLTTLSDEAAIAVRNALLFSELHKKADEISLLYEKEHRLFIHTSIAFAAAIDARDDYTHGHSERVTVYSLAIVDNLRGIPQIDANPRFKETLHIAALLHDIGKIGIKDEILHKKDKLTEEEMQTMRKHPVTGSIILSPIKELKDIIEGARYHHERYDGAGYPDGLKGERIPLIARIIGVADTFDAMTTDRPYRKKMDDAVAVQEIRNGAGTQFDPEVVGAFLKAYEKGALFGNGNMGGEEQMKAAG